MAFDTGLGSPSLDDFSLDLTSKEVGTDLGGAEQTGGELYCITFLLFMC